MAYSQKLMDHFSNPRNQGQLTNPSGVGQVGNPVCGDIMKIYLDIKKTGIEINLDKDVINDIKFETLGCGAAIACSSVLTEMAKNKTVSEALKITRANIADELGGVPSPKMHCSVLAADGLKAAIKNYLEKNKVLDKYPEIKKWTDSDLH